MEVQNISGADIISSRMDINPRVINENTKPENREPSEIERHGENTKGTIIDTKA